MNFGFFEWSKFRIISPMHTVEVHDSGTCFSEKLAEEIRNAKQSTVVHHAPAGLCR